MIRPQNDTPYINLGKQELAEHFGQVKTLDDLRGSFCTPQDVLNLIEAGLLKMDEPIYLLIRTRGRFPDEQQILVKQVA